MQELCNASQPNLSFQQYHYDRLVFNWYTVL